MHDAQPHGERFTVLVTSRVTDMKYAQGPMQNAVNLAVANPGATTAVEPAGSDSPRLSIVASKPNPIPDQPPYVGFNYTPRVRAQEGLQ